MASPNAVFTELVSTTLRNHPKMIFDNMSKNNALFRRINKKGNMTEMLDGGYEIARSIFYAENGSYQRYSGYDTLSTQPSDVITALNYAWKQVAMHVTANGLEIRSNSGKEQMMNLVKSRVKNAIFTFGNNMSLDLYSDGTASNQINGLQALIADAGTGTVGGVNSSTYTFWKNVVQSAAAPLGGGGAITPSATTIQGLMLGLYLELARGNDMTDLIVASNDYYTFYENSLVAQQRWTNESDEADGSFGSLKYKGADVIFDGGSKGGGIPSAHMYFINSNYLELCVHRDANFSQLEAKRSFNQDAETIPFIWQGNLVTTYRAGQGVLKA